MTTYWLKVLSTHGTTVDICSGLDDLSEGKWFFLQGNGKTYGFEKYPSKKVAMKARRTIELHATKHRHFLKIARIDEQKNTRVLESMQDDWREHKIRCEQARVAGKAVNPTPASSHCVPPHATISQEALKKSYVFMATVCQGIADLYTKVARLDKGLAALEHHSEEITSDICDLDRSIDDHVDDVKTLIKAQRKNAKLTERREQELRDKREKQVFTMMWSIVVMTLVSTCVNVWVRRDTKIEA